MSVWLLQPGAFLLSAVIRYSTVAHTRNAKMRSVLSSCKTRIHQLVYLFIFFVALKAHSVDNFCDCVQTVVSTGSAFLPERVSPPSVAAWWSGVRDQVEANDGRHGLVEIKHSRVRGKGLRKDSSVWVEAAGWKWRRRKNKQIVPGKMLFPLQRIKVDVRSQLTTPKHTSHALLTS